MPPGAPLTSPLDLCQTNVCNTEYLARRVRFGRDSSMWKFARAAMIVAGAYGVAASPLAASELRDKAASVFKPLPSTIPAVKDNKITKEKIELGKALFFDPRLSASGIFSCNSCHNIGTGGDDNIEHS